MRSAKAVFDSLSIRNKIFAGYIVVLVLAICLVLSTWTATNQQTEVLDDVADESVPQILALEALRSHGQQLIDAINTYAFSQTVRRLRLNGMSADVSKELDHMMRARDSFALALAKFNSTSYDDDAGSAQLERSITTASKDILRHPERIQKVANNNYSIDDLLSARSRFEGTATAFKGLIDRAIEWERRELTEDQAESDYLANESLVVAAGGMLLVIFISLAGGLLIANRVARPILRLRDSASRVGAGDFSVLERSMASDEVGQLINAFHDMALELQRDSAARKVSEEAVRVAQARMTDAIESIGDGFILYDSNDRLVMCNQRYRQMFAETNDLIVAGMSFEDIVRKSAERGQYVIPDGKVTKWVADRVRRHRESEESFEQQMSNGRWMRISDRRTHDGGIVGIRTDITEFKKTEEAVRLAQSRLEDAIESVSDGFILWGPDERLLACNGKYKEYFARAADLMIPGRTFEDIVRAATARGLYPDAVADPESWIAERLRRHREANGSFELRLDDGRWLRVSDQHTKEGGIAGIRTDITDRKTAEAELREANELLKATMEKLGRQERLATLGQVAGTVSHELRNPLGAIRNSMAVIRQLTTGKSLGLERSIERIDRSIERCNGIISDLLEFTRVRELNREPVAFDNWLIEMLDEHSFPDGIVVERRLGSDSEVAIDRNRFRQVLVNLLDNSAQAMTDAAWAPDDDHERRIVISTETAGPHVRLCVTDTGPGIPTETLSKIFEPLFTTKNFGVGLGLPTVRQIVEQHGGTIDVESAIDQGADFTIWLPRYFAAAQPSSDRREGQAA
ncbi:MAG: PAS-domain containing protein [Dongiaceae bacterium]